MKVCPKSQFEKTCKNRVSGLFTASDEMYNHVSFYEAKKAQKT